MTADGLDLKDFQRRFRRAVLESVTDHFIQDEMDECRLVIHRHTVQQSLVEVVAAAFPVVRRMVGAEFFDALARAFVTAMPPRQRHLSAYGADFSGFIAGFAPAAARPYLADVARLE